jgi:hypothetical protein
MRQKLWTNYFAKLNLSINDLNENLIKPDEILFENAHKIGNFALFAIILIICIAFYAIYKFKLQKLKISSTKSYVAISKREPNTAIELSPIELSSLQTDLSANAVKQGSTYIQKSNEPKVILTMK